MHTIGFIYLQKVFTKAPILYDFESEYYICIETDTLGFVISRVFS